MPTFSQTSKIRLSTCHEDLQRLFNEVIKYYDCIILEGHRGEEAQEEAVRTGKSKVHWPHGKHNSIPSNAVDVAPYFKEEPHIRWDDWKKWYEFGGFVQAIAKTMGIRLRWGGNWDGDDELSDQLFFDLPHFELKGE